MQGGQEPGSVPQEEQRQDRQGNQAAAAPQERSGTTRDRVLVAAERLARKYTSFPRPDDFVIRIRVPPNNTYNLGNDPDEWRFIMGLILHLNGKHFLKKENFRWALCFLIVAEETFNLCNSSAFENLDNLALLHIDIVWCYFMMKDNSLLSTAGIRLAEARNQFRHLHGEKLTAMHKRELVVYMTLDFLEGHVACCNGNFKQAQQLLTSAQDRYSELQIPDEALVPFLDMGYNEGETRKALRRSLLAASLALQLLEKEKKSEIQSIQTPYFCIFNLKIERGATSDIEGNSVQTTPGQKSGERNHTEEEEISKMEKKLLNNLFEVQFFDRYITLQNEAKLISGFYDWLFNIMRLPTMKSSSS